MPKLPRLTARQIITVLEKAGFSLARQSGSHMIYRNAAGRRATVPFHAANPLQSEVIPRPARIRFICGSAARAMEGEPRLAAERPSPFCNGMDADGSPTAEPPRPRGLRGLGLPPLLPGGRPYRYDPCWIGESLYNCAGLI